MKIVNGLWLSVLMVVLMAGCGTNPPSDQVRRAQLVGHENVQLKKQVDAQSAQIAQITKTSETTHKELMEKIVLLEQDKESLHKKLVQAQDVFDKTVADYQASMKTCQEQLDAKPTPCEEVEEKYAKLYGDLLNMLAECQGKLEKYEGQAASNQPPAASN